MGLFEQVPEQRPVIIGAEIQERLADMAIRSIALNGLNQQMSDHRGPARPDISGRRDIILRNPPYFAADEHLISMRVNTTF